MGKTPADMSPRAWKAPVDKSRLLKGIIIGKLTGLQTLIKLKLYLRSTSTAWAAISNGCCNALAVVLVGDCDRSSALGARVHAAVHCDDVCRVAVDVATGTGIAALS